MKNRSIKGFTLVELLVVVVVIGLLVSIAVPNLIGAQQKAKVAAVKGNMHATQTASESLAVDVGGSYASTPAVLAPYFPGGGNSLGGSAGTFPTNPITGVRNETPAQGVINSVALIRGVRTLAGNRNLGGSAGQTVYSGIPDRASPGFYNSYAVVGNNDRNFAIRTASGFFVLSNF